MDVGGGGGGRQSSPAVCLSVATALLRQEREEPKRRLGGCWKQIRFLEKKEEKKHQRFDVWSFDLAEIDDPGDDTSVPIITSFTFKSI